MRIDFPSLVVGAFAAATVFLFAAAQRPPAQEARFDLATNQNHVFVLDRDTGKVWEKYVTDESGQSDQDFALPKVGNR